jgi:thiosulfate/3-mercaptopyruvate sulfurtransferase
MPDPLIQPAELQALMACAQDLVVLGMTPSWRFHWCHLPGSRQTWRPQIGAGGGSRLIDAEGFQVWARQQGINDRSTVVIWDRRYDATRLWWAFQRFGHNDVRVLDGGLGAWKRCKLPIARGTRRPAPSPALSSFVASNGVGFPNAEMEEVLRSEMNPDVQLWDCRSTAEWSGRRRLRGARKAGRIPWARHLPWQLFRNDARRDRRFRTHAQIQEVIEAYGMNPAKRQLFYCQSGVRTTVPMLALARIGWDSQGLVNYDGSWREWSQVDALPWTTD